MPASQWRSLCPLLTCLRDNNPSICLRGCFKEVPVIEGGVGEGGERWMMWEVFFTSGAVKCEVHSALTYSLIGHCLHLKKKEKRKSIGRWSYILLWTEAEWVSPAQSPSDGAPITGALWLLQMDTIYLLSHPQVCCYGAAHWYSRYFIVFSHISGSSNVILFFCCFASTWLGCIIYHVRLHVQQLFCTTTTTTTSIHTIAEATYSVTVLTVSFRCTLSLHTCNQIFTMTSLTIKIDFLPLLLFVNRLGQITAKM